MQTLLKWVPQIGNLDNLRKLYFTGTSKGVEYALAGLHVSSRQNTNWVWGTFEHQMTPGRCDDIGCFDTFGATRPEVPPTREEVNTQYGPCEKTPALQDLMAAADLSPVWGNYCLKSTQVDYYAADGTPYVLGNAVIERIVGNGTVGRLVVYRLPRLRLVRRRRRRRNTLCLSTRPGNPSRRCSPTPCNSILCGV